MDQNSPSLLKRLLQISTQRVASGALMSDLGFITGQIGRVSKVELVLEDVRAGIAISVVLDVVHSNRSGLPISTNDGAAAFFRRQALSVEFSNPRTHLPGQDDAFHSADLGKAILAKSKLSRLGIAAFRALAAGLLHLRIQSLTRKGITPPPSARRHRIASQYNRSRSA